MTYCDSGSNDEAEDPEEDQDNAGDALPTAGACDGDRDDEDDEEAEEQRLRAQVWGSVVVDSHASFAALLLARLHLQHALAEGTGPLDRPASPSPRLRTVACSRTSEKV